MFHNVSTRLSTLLKRLKMSMVFEEPQREEKPRYCITVIREGKVRTVCGDDLAKLVNAVLVLGNVDVLTVPIPQETSGDVKLRVRFL